MQQLPDTLSASIVEEPKDEKKNKKSKKDKKKEAGIEEFMEGDDD